MKPIYRVQYFVQMLIILVFLSFYEGGCGSRAMTTEQSVSAVLDKMAYTEAEYGTIGISSPVLALPSNTFSFNPSAGPDQFFKDAQSSVQGSVSLFQQSALSAGAGANVTINPAAGSAYLAQLQQYQQAVTNNNSALDLSNLKIAMQNQAAYTQYQADMQSANAITDPAAKASAISTAQSKLANSLVGPQAMPLPAYPTATTQPMASGNLVSRPADLIQQFANGGNFAGFQGLASNQPTLGVNDRGALLTAAGNNSTKAIFQTLGDPSLANEFKDKRVLFGVCTVSIQPGWRTQKLYAADATTLVRMKYAVARPEVLEQYMKDPKIPAEIRERIRQQEQGAKFDSKLPYLDSRFEVQNKSSLNRTLNSGPHVAVISPLNDTQVLDVQSSDRAEQDIALSLNIAAQLSAAGLGGQAQAFLQYAKSRQQDIATVDPDVVVNATSFGTTFGFQIGPRLKASAGVDNGDVSKAAQILDRQSFPILVIIGIEQYATLPQVCWNSETKQYELWEPTLVLNTVNRWVPARRAQWFDNSKVFHPLFGWDYRDREPAPSESELIELSDEIDKELQKLDSNDYASQSAKVDLDKAQGIVDFYITQVEATAKNVGNAEAAVHQFVATKEHQDDLRKAQEDERTANIALEIAKNKLSEANKDLAATTSAQGSTEDSIPDGTRDLIESRAENLKGELFGGESNVFLPALILRQGDTATVSSVQPNRVLAGTSVQVAILGQNLDDVDLKRIGLVTGTVSPSDTTLQPPFHATYSDNAIFLTFTPNAFAIGPTNTQAQANFRQAKSNFDQVMQYAGNAIQKIDSAQKGLEVAFTTATPPLALKNALNTTNEEMSGVLTDLRALLATLAFDEAWSQIQPSDWTTAQLDILKPSQAALDNFNGVASLAADITQLKASWKALPAPSIDDAGRVVPLSDEQIKGVSSETQQLFSDILTDLKRVVPPDSQSLESLVAVESSAMATLDLKQLSADLQNGIKAPSWTKVLLSALDFDLARLDAEKLSDNPTKSRLTLDSAVVKLEGDFNANAPEAAIKTDATAVVNQGGELQQVLLQITGQFPNPPPVPPNVTADPAAAQDAALRSEISAAQSQQQSLKLLLATTADLWPKSDELVSIRANLVDAAKARDSTIGIEKKQADVTDQTKKLAQSNLQQAKQIASELQTLASPPSNVSSTGALTSLSSSESSGKNNIQPSDAAAMAALQAAQSNLASAQSILAEAQPDQQQTIVFSFPSSSDPKTVVYTTPIAVGSGEPSDLVIAPQVIQLQTSASVASAPSAGSSTGSSASPPNGSSASAKPKPVTVLIAGNNLNSVEIQNIAMVPPTTAPLNARIIGNSIALDISVTSADSAISFDLPVKNSTRHFSTPPITVKPAPAQQNTTTSPTGEIPTVSAVAPTSIILTPTQQEYPFFIIGTNLDQVDLTNLSVTSGKAVIDNSPMNQPIFADGTIKVNLIILDASAPISIGLPLRSNKSQIINSLPLNISLTPKGG